MLLEQAIFLFFALAIFCLIMSLFTKFLIEIMGSKKFL